jgi:multidrug efflux system membrane fusion protein
VVLGLLLSLIAMRHEHSNAEASTVRRWAMAPEAPTHLPVDRPDDAGADADDELATMAARATGSQPRRLPIAEAAPVPVPVAAPAFMEFAGGAAFDPNQVAMPPELAAPVFAWVRRLALQADLVAADRVLRDAVAELTSSLTVVIIYAGPDGFYTVGPEGELPKDTQPLLAVGKARRSLVGPHSGLVPIATTTETLAVIQLARNVRQPVFALRDHLTMAAIARESASVLHHLVVQHLQGRLEHAADQQSLYRPEALEYHRKKGAEGTVAELSPRWIKRAYPILGISMLVAILFGIFIRVPTYTTGYGLIHSAGTPVTVPSTGTVEAIYVNRGDYVHLGDPVAKLASTKEDADYQQVNAESENALQTYLFDDQDEQARKSVKTATAALNHAISMQDLKIVRATAEGRVSDIHANPSKAVQMGDLVMQIIKPNTRYEVWAYLNSTDRPRIKPNMHLQVSIIGFNKKPAQLEITSISNDAVGAAEIRREIGQDLADTLKLSNEGSYILVKGEFAGDTIKVGKKEFSLHQGMSTKVEIKIDTKPFLVTIFPLFEKYVD